MRIGRRRAALGTFAGASANMLVASLQAIVLMPLYLRCVGDHLYGAWMASGEILVWMLAFDAGIPNVVTQRVAAAHAAEDYAACGRAFGAGAAILALLAGGLALVLCGLSPFVPHWLNVDGPEARTLSICFAIAAITTCAMLLDYSLHGLARGLQNTGQIYRYAIAGTLIGFGVTAAMLLAGYGLYAIAIGLVLRVGIALLGSIVFFLRVDRRIRQECRPTPAAMKELFQISPATFTAGIVYAAANNSMITMAAVMIRPEAAVVLGITKRASDLGRSIADMIGFASYGGFAHLYAEENGPRTRDVYAEIHATYATVALSLIAAVVALNPSLIATWTGASKYGGNVLNVLIGLAALSGGWSYAAANLLRATGRQVEGSMIVAVEGIARLPLMAALCHVLGPIGLPLAGIATGTVAGIWAHVRTVRELSPQPMHPAYAAWFARGATLSGAILCTTLLRVQGWLAVLATGAVVLAVMATVLVLADDRLRPRLPGLVRTLRARAG